MNNLIFQFVFDLISKVISDFIYEHFIKRN